MDTLILLTYAFIVWLLVKKFKVIPWNMVSQVIIFTIPVVFMSVLILIMNVNDPSSPYVKVTNRVININPMVKGRVNKIYVDPLTPVQKGDTLFTIDATPYKVQVKTLRVKIKGAEASLDAQAYGLESLREQTDVINAKLELAIKRRDDFQSLMDRNAGKQFDLDNAISNVQQLEAQLAANKNKEEQILTTLTTEYDGNQVSIAELLTLLEKAEWDLAQCTIVAPADGMVVNMQLRVGSIAVAFPISPSMTFVEKEQKVIATFDQNELVRVEKGQEVEATFRVLPGKVFVGKVHEVVYVQGEGQVTTGLKIPNSTTLVKGGKWTVVYDFDEEFPMGANGSSVIYTNDHQPFKIMRQVLIRVESKMNFLVLKLH